ncbi:MAG TPA: DUF937 domain-containing protein, partial [Vicinamibacterales bacterium]|nr:DUF937 domain-containing protein [Vicinamibacterales bacterium]
MATSLVDTIAQSMSSGLISRFSAATGESASHVQTGLSAAVRAITASMAMRADDPEAMAQIHAMAVEPANDLSLPDRTEGLVSRAISGSSQVTSSDFIQSLLLGNRTSNMADSLASDAGVSKATARSMFSIATSLVLSSLGKVIRTDRLDSAALSSRLADERESIVAGLPAGLSKFYPSVGATAQDVAATIPSRAPVAAARVATAEKQRTAWT